MSTFPQLGLEEEASYRACNQNGYVTILIALNFKNALIDVFKEYKDRFAWEYEDMPGLS